MISLHNEIDGNKKLAIVLGGDDIIGSSIKYLLAERADWQVINILNNEDADAMLPPIMEIHPDIVIIPRECCENPAYPILQLLVDQTDIKVIIISLENNLLNVYDKQTVLITDARDLISIIDDEK